MRRITALSASILVSLALGGPAAAADAPDLSPLTCAWDKLPVGEQTRLKDEFKVELREGGFTLHFAAPNAASTAEAAGACGQNPSAAQIDNLGLALARRAAEEKARKGISDKGEKPDSIQAALDKMHEGKRELIGNKLACPGPHPSVSEWDDSVKGAVRRANLRFKDGRAYSWVSLGLYAAMAQEGAMRRMQGKAEACS